MKPYRPKRIRPRTPNFEPIAVVNHLWTCRIPPVGTHGEQVFKSTSLPELLSQLQRSIFHSQWFINAVADENRELRRREQEHKLFTEKVLGITKGNQ